MKTWTARPGVVLFLVLTAGCGIAQDVPGTFELVSLNSAPLPQALGDNRCQGSLIGGSLTMRDDSTWRGQLVVRDPCSAITDTSHYAGGWAMRRKELRMTIDSFAYQPTPRRRFLPAVHDSLAGTLTPPGLVLVYGGFKVHGEPLRLGIRRVR